MKYFKHFVLALILALPVNVFAGPGTPGVVWYPHTDISFFDYYLSGYYDLRDRKTYIQITTDDPSNTCEIHIQIFQHDKGCTEINFFDTLTTNDTVVYDLDNLIKNNGEAVPANLGDDSYGYVVVVGDMDNGCEYLIGNSRIIDDAGYEYRTNLLYSFSEPIGDIESIGSNIDFYANFNTMDGANQADIISYSYILEFSAPSGPKNVFAAKNNFKGFDFDIYTLDMNEEPLSCDRRNFACGNVMNYGVNEDYPNSKGGPLLCPGAGLADPKGGFIHFDNIGTTLTNLDFINFDSDSEVLLHTYIGINNGDGTGSMDAWHYTCNGLPDCD